MLEKALKSIRETLSYDGYDLVFEEKEGGILDIRIVAGPDACAECLLPKEVLREIIAKELTEKGVPFKSIELTLPVETTGSL
ncbi:MAG: hypothetical protein GX767_00185 [Firmicutes bacterium]|nr:hypothetical protein [Bacillota bacterium]